MSGRKKIVVYMDHEDFRLYSDLVIRDNISSNTTSVSKGPYILSIINEWMKFREELTEIGIPFVNFSDIINHAKKDISWTEKVV